MTVTICANFIFNHRNTEEDKRLAGCLKTARIPRTEGSMCLCMRFFREFNHAKTRRTRRREVAVCKLPVALCKLSFVTIESKKSDGRFVSRALRREPLVRVLREVCKLRPFLLLMVINVSSKKLLRKHWQSPFIIAEAINRRLIGQKAICRYSCQQIHQEINRAPVSAVFNLTDVFQKIIY